MKVIKTLFSLVQIKRAKKQISHWWRGEQAIGDGKGRCRGAHHGPDRGAYRGPDLPFYFESKP